MVRVRFSEGAGGIRTTASAASKRSASPWRPRAHVAPAISPVLPWPEASNRGRECATVERGRRRSARGSARRRAGCRRSRAGSRASEAGRRRDGATPGRRSPTGASALHRKCVQRPTGTGRASTACVSVLSRIPPPAGISGPRSRVNTPASSSTTPSAIAGHATTRPAGALSRWPKRLRATPIAMTANGAAGRAPVSTPWPAESASTIGPCQRSSATIKPATPSNSAIGPASPILRRNDESGRARGPSARRGSHENRRGQGGASPIGVEEASTEVVSTVRPSRPASCRPWAVVRLWQSSDLRVCAL
jgi:hypothetical protein